MTDRSEVELLRWLLAESLWHESIRRGELEATQALLEGTREQLNQVIADFCALRDALPYKQVEQILGGG